MADAPTLHHAGTSSCSQRVRLALAERGLPWVSREVDMRAGEHLGAAFLALNPAGLVPVLVDGEQVIPESAAILTHLATGAGDPPDAAARAQMAVADVAQGPLKVLTHEWMFRARGPAPAGPTRPDPEANAFAADFAANGPAWHRRTNDAVRAMAAAVEALEAALAGRDWFGAPSEVDWAWGPTLHRLDLLGWPWASRPAIAAYLARLRARPNWAEAVTRWEPPPMRVGQAAYLTRRTNDRTALADVFGEMA